MLVRSPNTRHRTMSSPVWLDPTTEYGTLDARQRLELRQALRAAVTAVPSDHCNARVDAFLKSLGERLRGDRAVCDALRRTVWNLSPPCEKEPPFRRGDDEPPCFCDQCVGCVNLWPSSAALDDEDASGHSSGQAHDLGLIVVYPKYDWIPPTVPDPRSQLPVYAHERHELEQEQKWERAAHRYLQRLGRLPQPLPSIQCDQHLALLPEDLLNTHRVTKLADSSITPDAVRKAVVSEARQCKVLWVAMCGHGAGEELVLADHKRVNLQRVIMSALYEARFRGTVVISLNACGSADPPAIPGFGPNPPPGVTAPEGWDRTQPWPHPFRWVLVYNCWREPQQAAHADHFARMLGRLVVERPEYRRLKERVAELWEVTRDVGAGPEFWRAPPSVHMGGMYGGRFLEPAT